jgi:PilX N-terminal
VTDERGVALVLALMAVLLLSALGLALAATASTELLIASNYRNGQQALYAADAAAERALAELPAVSWNTPFDGSTTSSFTDGPAAGIRTLADGSALDLAQVVAAACGGGSDPAWHLYAWGPVTRLLPAGQIDSAFYLVVLVADDPFESDVLSLRAEAFGPRGAHKVVELTAVRADTTGEAVRVLSWREIR